MSKVRLTQSTYFLRLIFFCIVSLSFLLIQNNNIMTRHEDQHAKEERRGLRVVNETGDLSRVLFLLQGNHIFSSERNKRMKRLTKSDDVNTDLSPFLSQLMRLDEGTPSTFFYISL